MNIHNHILVQMVQDHQHLSSQNICIRNLPALKQRVWLYDKNLTLSPLTVYRIAVLNVFAVNLRFLLFHHNINF